MSEDTPVPVEDSCSIWEIAAFYDVEEEKESDAISFDQFTVNIETELQHSNEIAAFSEVTEDDKCDFINSDQSAANTEADNQYSNEIAAFSEVTEEINTDDFINWDHSAVNTEADNQQYKEMLALLEVKKEDKIESTYVDHFTPGLEVYYQQCMKLSETEVNKADSINLDQSAVVTEFDNQPSREIDACLVEDNKPRPLFAPFNHQMTPDLEYLKLVSERSASNQEITSNLIKDRYKLIKECTRTKEKEKEREEKKKFNRSLQNVSPVQDIETARLSPSAIEEIVQTIQNLCLRKESRRRNALQSAMQQPDPEYALPELKLSDSEANSFLNPVIDCHDKLISKDQKDREKKIQVNRLLENIDSVQDVETAKLSSANEETGQPLQNLHLNHGSLMQDQKNPDKKKQPEEPSANQLEEKKVKKN